MTRYVELAAEQRLAPAYAALIDAARHVGDRQVRNRGTIGGSVCWNYIAACMPAVALTLDATMNLVSGSGGQRSLPAQSSSARRSRRRAGMTSFWSPCSCPHRQPMPAARTGSGLC